MCFSPHASVHSHPGPGVVLRPAIAFGSARPKPTFSVEEIIRIANYPFLVHARLHIASANKHISLRWSEAV
jgi:hypothetical protein